MSPNINVNTGVQHDSVSSMTLSSMLISLSQSTFLIVAVYTMDFQFSMDKSYYIFNLLDIHFEKGFCTELFSICANTVLVLLNE